VNEPTDCTTEQPPAPWLLAPADLAAIRADTAMLDWLAAGGEPGPSDPDPVAAQLAVWLRDVEDGDAR
jgi:hypothetical protein